MRAFLRLLSLLSLLSLSLPAQETPPPKPPDPRGGGTGATGSPDAQPGTAGGVGWAGEEEVQVGRGDLGKMEAEGMGKPLQPQLRNAQGFCTFVTSVSPETVPPGGRGVMTVTMLLQGDAVLTAPPPVRFKTVNEQGPFQVGTPSFRPPQAGFLSEAFRGQQVYDNYAIFEVPFGVKRDTPFGEFRVVTAMEFELHNGSTGEPIETFLQRVGAAVEIGLPSPETSLQLPIDDGTGQSSGSNEGRAVTGSESLQASTSPEAAADAPPAGAGKAVGAEIGEAPRATGDLAQGPVEEAREPIEDLAAPESSELPWILGGLAGVLLLLGLVLLRRR